MNPSRGPVRQHLPLMAGTFLFHNVLGISRAKPLLQGAYITVVPNTRPSHKVDPHFNMNSTMVTGELALGSPSLQNHKKT